MILTQQDIDEFQRAYLDVVEVDVDSDELLATFFGWLSNHPQVFASAGFQEFVGSHELSLYKSLVKRGEFVDMKRPVFRDYTGHWILPSGLGILESDSWLGYRLEALEYAVREAERLEREIRAKYAGDRYLPDDHIEKSEQLVNEAACSLPCFDEIINKAAQYISNPLVDPTLFVSPRLWTPFNQKQEKQFLQTSALGIIMEIQKQKRELAAIHWKELEEIIAELLRSNGMEIHLVDESPQGGRDIIARYNAIPGTESLTIAVEVKHMDVVNRPFVQTALYQNRHFPALMFLTSGQFSIGAVEEARKPENRMRLFLYDGVAVCDMIKNYRL